MSVWLDFLGRWHPLVLHLPIGIFVFALLLDLRGRFRPTAAWSDVARHAHGWAALTAVISCVTGWLLASDYHTELLDRHRWFGMATASAMIVVWMLRRGNGAGTTLRLGSSAIAALLLVATGHLGGTMMYGENFISSALPPPFGPAKVETPASDTVYGALIHPMLAASCVKCHGPEKAKKNIRMDSHDRLLRADGARLVVPGHPEESQILVVTQLPRDDEDAMPPEGKADPLTADQLAVLTWWIREGAKADQPLASIPAELKPAADAVRTLFRK